MKIENKLYHIRKIQMAKNNWVDIPMDIYESNEELVILMPLWGVSKKSIQIDLEKTTLTVKWVREKPALKENLAPLQEECYWGEFVNSISLPQNVYFEKIHTKLTAENILVIIVPKIIIPEKLKIEIEFIK